MTAQASHINMELCHRFLACTVGRAKSARMLSSSMSFHCRAMLWSVLTVGYEPCTSQSGSGLLGHTSQASGTPSKS